MRTLIKSATAILLILLTVVSLMGNVVFADSTGAGSGDGNQSGIGSGGWNNYKSGYRFSLVTGNEDGTDIIVHQSADFVTDRGYDELEKDIVGNKVEVKTSSKFGKAKEYLGRFNFSDLREIIGIKGTFPDVPVVGLGSSASGTGASFFTTIKNSNFEYSAKIITDKRLFDQTIVNKYLDKGVYLIVEPIFWYTPTTNTNTPRYTSIVYGTVTNLAQFELDTNEKYYGKYGMLEIGVGATSFYLNQDFLGIKALTKADIALSTAGGTVMYIPGKDRKDRLKKVSNKTGYGLHIYKVTKPKDPSTSITTIYTYKDPKYNKTDPKHPGHPGYNPGDPNNTNEPTQSAA